MIGLEESWRALVGGEAEGGASFIPERFLFGKSLIAL
jgi:hypothetical protein